MLSEPLIFGHETLSREQLLLDRGLHYGDGLFETIAVVSGCMPLLELHLLRLERDCQRLMGSYPQEDVQQRLARVQEVLVHYSQPLVVKLLITRGVSGRGYGFSDDTPLRVFAFIYPYQPPAMTKRLSGLLVIHCSHHLSDRGMLGSIKHCNRLDQVYARADVQRHVADEGLMYSDTGHLIEATSANVAVKLHGQWLTPELSHVGIAGVARQLMIDKGLLKVANISQSALSQATGMALINSVQGIMPVSVLPDIPLHEAPESILRELSADLPHHFRGVW
ncbi:MAG TPA: aminotransferase class IV [Pseudomonadales bacterium]|nr:aminotransferase class IV [Pseudomonadales bacterium]